MQNVIISITYYGTVILLVLSSFIYLRRRNSPDVNLFSIKKFIQKIDIAKDGQRFQGGRFILDRVIDQFRDQDGTVTFEALYKTPSGRHIYLLLKAAQGAVIHWEMDALTTEEYGRVISYLEGNEDAFNVDETSEVADIEPAQEQDKAEPATNP